MAVPQSCLFQLQYRESGNVRSMQHTPPSQLQTGSEKPLSTLWFHVTILSLMSEGKKYSVFPKIPWQRKHSIQSDRTHRRFYLQNYLFIRAPDTHPLPKTLSNNPSDHCISLSAPFFDHSSMAPVECAHVKEACMNPHSSSDRTCTCPFWQPTHSEHKRSQRAR